MRKSPKAALGVTLLEIMLVLAIAAMVIVMSIRYYQSASNNQKMNVALNDVTAIIAAGESVMGAKGNLSSAAVDIPPYLPKGVLPNSPWGTQMKLANKDAISYSVEIYIPTTTCPAFKALLEQNSRITAVCSTNLVTLTINSNT